MNASEIIEKLDTTGRIDREECALLLSSGLDESSINDLERRARIKTDIIFGREVYVRGLLEITSVCRNNCLYCGLRRGNAGAMRYTLPHAEIKSACRAGYDAGLRTFVVQGGENPALSKEYVAQLVAELRTDYPDVAITLSLGEWPDEAYEMFREAGATRYLLRHETYCTDHYASLHPQEMSRENRLRCLATLKRLGFQTGTGIMVGSPYQQIEHIIDDLEFMQSFRPEMIGIGPFIPASGTPFENAPAGSVDLTVRLISILRLMFPSANIPSTTALATLCREGRIRGLLAGANVVMPNITPLRYREAYSIYDNKASSGAEAAEGLKLLRAELATAGLEISPARGDFKQI